MMVARVGCLVLVAVRWFAGQAAGQAAPFQPGGQELFNLDLGRTPIGELPGSIRRLCEEFPCAARLEVADKDGKRMLRASEPSAFLITLAGALPEQFTLEFEVVPKECCPPPDLSVEGSEEINQGQTSAHLIWQADHYVAVIGGAEENREFQIPEELQPTLPGKLTRVEVSVDGNTIRLFTNGQRIYEHQARFARGTVLRVFLGGMKTDEGVIQPVYLARLRIATGAPATAIAALPLGPTTGTITPMAPPPPPPTVVTPADRPTGEIQALSTGPAPTGLSVSGTPGTATLSWAAVAGATGYEVFRAPAGTSEWTAVTAGRVGETKVSSDQLPNPLGTYTYRVRAYQADGRFGAATVDFTPPPPTDPAGFVATLVPPAGVTLTWNAVKDASEYVVSGPGFPADARAATTSISIVKAPPGLNAYRVASVFPPGKVLTAPSTWPSATLKVPPIPSVAFLTLPNGTGSLAEYNRHACNTGQWVAAELVWPNDWCGLPGPNSVARIELKPLLDLFGIQLWTPWGEAPPTSWTTYSESEWAVLDDRGGENPRMAPLWWEARFIDVADLERARRVGCLTRGTAPNTAMLCWAVSRAPDETPPGVGPAARRGLLSVLIQESNGTHFLLFREVEDPASPSGWKMVGSPTVALDSQGERFLPHVCLACHGGRFDSKTGRVTGATPLALDPRGFEGLPGEPVNGGTNSAAMYKAHQAMLKAPVAAGVRDYINGMYVSRPYSQPYISMSAIPPGWTTQPEVFTKIYRPYCASCHSAQTGPLGFRSWSDMLREKVRIKQAICTGRMPHAEVPFRKFWSEGGEVSLPGWLLGALGYTGCG